MTIVIIILLALIYWRLHDIVTAIHFQGTIFDHEDYFNKERWGQGWWEPEKPIKEGGKLEYVADVDWSKPKPKRKVKK